MFKLLLTFRFLLILLLSSNAYAAPPTRAYSYVANTVIDPNQNNTNENALYTYLQTGVDTFAAGSVTGAAISSSAAIPYTSLSLSNSILNADINSSAAIVDTKLAQITTASKVSGAALTSLTSVPSGAGLLPLANTPISYKLVSSTRTGSTASGTQAVTGVGFTPRAIILIAGFASSIASGGAGKGSVGLDDLTTHGGLISTSAIGAGNMAVLGASIGYVESAANYNTAVVSSLDADGFTLTWTKTGSPTDLITFYALCFR